MKEKKKLFLLPIIAICALFVFGIHTVNAADISNATGRVICDPGSFDKAETVTCYLLLGGISSGEEAYAINAKVILTDMHLASSPVDSSGKPTLPDANKAKESIKGEAKENGILGIEFINPGANSSYTAMPTITNPCQSTSASSDSVQEFCTLFYSTTSVKAISSAKLNSMTIQGEGNNTYYKVGSFKLKQNENLTADKTCGKICVIARYYSESSSTAGGDVQHAQGEECNEVTVVKPADEPGTPPETPPPPTGNFTSYAILAAGAFIAICAVLVAKKNNKFYKV